MQKHITVLLDEAVTGLAIKEDAVVVDATFGSGGHAEKILSCLGPKGIFVGMDADPVAIHEGEKYVRGVKPTTYLKVRNHRDIDRTCEELRLSSVDAIIADLGWRMEQFSGNGKGFSFQVDEDLIMTYGDNASYAFVAKDIVNEWSEDSIRNVLVGYGEERFATRIAQNIVEARVRKPIQTTFDLVEIVKEAVPTRYHHGRTHPATRTFQALRIAVNDEFGTLEMFIKKSIALLRPKGRLAIISFHSLEDRIVKHLFKNFTHDQVGVMVHKKPIVPTSEEIKKNPRSRSAKLRIFEKNYEEKN